MHSAPRAVAAGRSGVGLRGHPVHGGGARSVAQQSALPVRQRRRQHINEAESALQAHRRTVGAPQQRHAHGRVQRAQRHEPTARGASSCAQQHRTAMDVAAADGRVGAPSAASATSGGSALERATAARPVGIVHKLSSCEQRSAAMAAAAAPCQRSTTARGRGDPPTAAAGGHERRPTA
jgi:hypothetical protein